MTVTYVPQTRTRAVLSGRKLDAVDVSKGAGLLELYVCLGCGRAEWYCDEPGNIPIGPQYMTELVDVETDAPPYR